MRIAVTGSLACLAISAGCGRIGFGAGEDNTDGDAAIADSDTPAVDCANLADQVLYLPLDDGAGLTARDDSGGGHTGNLFGGPVWTAGQRAGGLRFDGTNDAIVAFQNAATLTDLGALTACAWVNVNTFAGSFATIFDKSSDGTANGWNLYAVSDGRYGLFVNSGAYVQVRGLAQDTWQHVCGTWDGALGAAGLRLYIDGAAQSVDQSSSGGPIQSDAGQNLAVGRASAGDSYPLDGALDELRIFDRALTPAEVSRIYECGL